MAPAADSVFDKFRDFDDFDCYDDAARRTSDERSKNFVVCFGADEAQIAFDLVAQDVTDLLNAPARSAYPIRWM